MKKRALVIGCGQIGARYDLDNPDLCLTHAKGYHLSPLTELVGVVDPDDRAAWEVAERYGCTAYRSLEAVDLDAIDILSICVPTPLHFSLLEQVYRSGYRANIILEKPVAATIEEVQAIQNFERAFLDRIYINYIRRFDPTYRQIIRNLQQEGIETIQRVTCNYFGAFEHNAIHALNLFNHLFGRQPSVAYFGEQSALLRYGHAEALFSRLATDYLNFEITLFTQTKKIAFARLGYEAIEYEAAPSKRFPRCLEAIERRRRPVLNGYVLSMIEQVLQGTANLPTINEGIADFYFVKEAQSC